MSNKYFHENASPFTVSKLKALNRKWFGQHKRHSLFESAEGPNITIVSKPGQVDRNSLTDSTSSMWCSIERTWIQTSQFRTLFFLAWRQIQVFLPKTSLMLQSPETVTGVTWVERIWKNPAQAFLPILPVQGKLVYAQTFADPVTSRSASPRNLITDVMTCLVPAQKAGERILLILAFWECMVRHSATELLPHLSYKCSMEVLAQGHICWQSTRHQKTWAAHRDIVQDRLLASTLTALFKVTGKNNQQKNAGLWPHWFCKLKTFGPATHRLSMAETFVFDKPIRHQYFVIHGANT